MQAVLKSLLDSAVRWSLICMAIGAMAIMPLSAQVQDKGFVVASPKNIAQPLASTQGTRWALLVGIANYPAVEGFEIQQLKAPVKDVNALAAFLKDPEKGGFDADRVLTLTDEEATKREILMTFNDIAKRAAPEDMVLFYFSGHGIPPDHAESTYLVPYDHDLRDVETTCINFGDLSRKIRRMEASKVVVILDACHSGGIKAKDARSGRPKGLYEGYIKAFQESEGRPLLLSSGESEVSWETEEYGIFTHFLLEGLSGGADTDNDGIVTFAEVSEFVRETVKRHTSENFPRVQEPTVRFLPDPVRGDIPLAINWRKVNRQRQQDLLDKRNTAIYQAVSAGLDQVLKDFSLRVAKSAYDKALKGEGLTEQEFLLLQETDALKGGTITAADYITRARAIYNIGLTQLRIAVTPTDARVTLTATDAPDRIISPSSPNIYQIEPGRYRLSVQRQGYAPHSRELALDLANEEVTVTLERLMGILQLQIDPVDAAVTTTPLSMEAPDTEIKVSKPFRVQPIGGRQLPVGTYRLTAEKEGYEPDTREPVEIKANASTPVTLVLKPKPATIVAPNLPDGTRSFVNGQPIELPHGLPPGTYRIRLERDGFQPFEMAKALKAGQILDLRPEWVPETPEKTQDRSRLESGVLSLESHRGVPRVGAFAASLVVPGLGQHLQRRHVRGSLYEVAVIGVGAAALWAMMKYQGALDDYEDAQGRLQVATAQIQPQVSLVSVQKRAELIARAHELLVEQEDTHDEAESARTLSIATQIALGIVWGINALDAGIIRPPQRSDEVTFGACLTSDGAQVLVRASF